MMTSDITSANARFLVCLLLHTVISSPFIRFTSKNLRYTSNYTDQARHVRNGWSGSSAYCMCHLKSDVHLKKLDVDLIIWPVTQERRDVHLKS